jgi:hypothetical protein
MILASDGAGGGGDFLLPGTTLVVLQLGQSKDLPANPTGLESFWSQWPQ